MVDAESLIVPASQYNLANDRLCAIGRKATPVALAEAFAGAFQLASQCWDAQKFYANECERLRDELRQLRTISPTTTGEK